MSKGLIDRSGSLMRKLVSESRKPSLGFVSEVECFGGKWKLNEHGTLYFDMSGAISRLDRFGDRILRRWDDNVPRLTGNMFDILRGNLLRYRGNPREIYENVMRLNLTRHYAHYQDGIVVLNPECFTTAVSLLDIFRLDCFAGVDREKAVQRAAKFLALTHQKNGPVGEVLPSDVLFEQVVQGMEVDYPFWGIPDIVPAEGANFDRLKALDLLDFVFSVGFEEYRKSGSSVNAQTIALKALEAYSNWTVIYVAHCMLELSRYTLRRADDGVVDRLMWQHNRARLQQPCVGANLLRLIKRISEAFEEKARAR